MKTPILKTERLILRPLKISDAPHIYKSWGSDDDVSHYMRWETHGSVEKTRQWLEIEEQNLESNVYTWGFELKDKGELIGSGGLLINEKRNCYELGYNLAKAFWGKGFATESAHKILSFAKDELHAEKIFCCHALENTASERIIQKLGFEYVKDGTYSKFNGKIFPRKEYYLWL